MKSHLTKTFFPLTSISLTVFLFIKLVWIKKVVLKGKKYLVYINDEEEGISFTEDQIVNNRIVKGNSFYEKDWKKIIKSLDEGILLDKTLKYIDYKPRTKKEVIDYLEEHNATVSNIKNIVKKLTEINFIDDDRYACIFIEEEIRHQKGPNAIKHVLLTKGIDEIIINKYLEKYSNELLFENALDMGNKTLKTVIGLPIQKQKESVYTRLYRMGYDYSMITKVLSMLEYSSLDFERLEKDYLKIKSKEENQNKIIQKLLAKGYNYSDIKQVINNIEE